MFFPRSHPGLIVCRPGQKESTQLPQAGSRLPPRCGATHVSLTYPEHPQTLHALLNHTQPTNRRFSGQRRVRDSQFSEDVHKQHLSRQNHQPERPRSSSQRRQAARRGTRRGRSGTSTCRRRALGCAECDHYAAHFGYQQIVHR